MADHNGGKVPVSCPHGWKVRKGKTLLTVILPEVKHDTTSPPTLCGENHLALPSMHGTVEISRQVAGTPDQTIP